MSINRRDFLRGTGASLALSLGHLQWIAPTLAWSADKFALEGPAYHTWEDLYRQNWQWDKVQKATHFVNCWYQSSCNWNVYVKNGMVWREEQAGIYKQTNPEVPDFNPRGCQKGACYSERMYDPSRIQYPLKRAGKRGEGKWQRVPWDQALTEIADEFITTLSKEGPAAINWEGGSQISYGGINSFGFIRTAALLDAPMLLDNALHGDDHQGAAVTTGKIVFCSSADDMFYASTILIWGANPVYTQIPNYHFINEARYHGTRIIALCPDYSPSSIHADLWVPVKIGSDAALALAMSQVIVSENLHKVPFLKEQTDMPLLVREDNRLFLRESDLKRGGAEDIFFVWDLRSKSVRAISKDTLKLDGIDPALEGEYEVETSNGKVRLRPVFELLKTRLGDYTPEIASKICGTNPDLIRTVAHEIARSDAVTSVTQANFSKFYHGMEMERAQMLVLALCGHFGRKGAGYQAFPFLLADAAKDAFLYPNMPLPQGKEVFEAKKAPWIKSLKDKGYTDEMIAYEESKGGMERRVALDSVLHLYFHGGINELSKDQRKWDPSMRRDFDEYLKLSLERGWQFGYPEVPPRILFVEGGNFIRVFRGYPKLIDHLLPKLRLLVVVDWRLSNTGRYADYILPCAAWYERNDTRWATPLATYLHASNQAVKPLGGARLEWSIHCLLAKKIQERAVQRGLTRFQDRSGKERKLDHLYDDLTYGGNYQENDDIKLLRDFIAISGNLAGSTWDKLSKHGITKLSNVGRALASIGNATDLKANETITPLTWHVRDKMPWPTLTRRMQFYIDHELYLELGEVLPVHKDEFIGGNYPLRMTGGHTRHSIHTSWRDDKLMLQLQRGEPEMFVSVADARARGIEDHDLVRVYNDVGAFEIRVKVSPSCAPGQVIVYHAWEPYQFKDGYSHQTVTPGPINPIELAGQYFHLRPTWLGCLPGQNDRGVRVEIEKANRSGRGLGLKV